mgnify:CR=1 FL=1
MNSGNKSRTPHPASLGDYRVPEDRATLIRADIAWLGDTGRGVSEQRAFAADVSDIAGVLEAGADADDAGVQ